MTHTQLLEVLRRALQMECPALIVLAGSNGAGKATFYDLYLRRLALPFVSAARIAQFLDPSLPGHVARQAVGVADAARLDLVKQGLSFCMATEFSDPAGDEVQFLKEAQTEGYAVIGLFITLSNPALCAARVAQRVSRGGHDVPDDELESRFVRTAQNIRAALQFADVGLFIDNSSADTPYRLIEIWEQGDLRSHPDDVPDEEP